MFGLFKNRSRDVIHGFSALSCRKELLKIRSDNAELVSRYRANPSDEIITQIDELLAKIDKLELRYFGPKQ